VLSANNGYAGGTTLANGTLVLNNNNALGTGALTINGGTLDSTVAGVTLANNAQNWNGDFTFNGTQSLNTGTGPVTLGSSRVVTVNAGNLTVGGIVSGAGDSLTLAGSGMLTLTSSNTYTGDTIVSGGTLTLNFNGNNHNGTGAIRGNLTINPGAYVSLTQQDALGWATGGVAVPTVNVIGSTIDDAANANQAYITNFLLTGGSMSSSGGGSYNFNSSGGYGITTNASSATSVISGGLLVRSGALPVNVAQGTTANGVDLLVSGNITGAGNGLTETGAGLMALTGSNTYTGATTINGGTLQIGNGGTLGSLSTSSTIADNATLAFNRSDNIAQGTQFTGSPINGSGGLVQLGPGMLTLDAANNYTGGTTVLDGTLVLANDEAIAEGTSLTVGDASAFDPALVVPHVAAGFRTEPQSAITPVPEPGTLAILAAVLGTGMVYRRTQRVFRRR
jgi:autotransporter-associated beta strand protein